jgi:hypothetical protein
LFNMHNMAQIKLNITERYVELPRRANLRLNMAYFYQKYWQMHWKFQVMMSKIAAEIFGQKLHCM